MDDKLALFIVPKRLGRVGEQWFNSTPGNVLRSDPSERKPRIPHRFAPPILGEVCVSLAQIVLVTNADKKEPTSFPQFVRKRQLAVMLSVSPRTIDTWVAKRMIPFIEPTSRLHLFDPVAVAAALTAQFSVPPNRPLPRDTHDNA